MKKNLKAYLIDAKNQIARSVETEDELDALYSLLDCDMIEIHAITIAGNPKVFDVVMDEEGTFKADPKISAINEEGQPMFVGSLLITGTADKEGNLTDLTEDDIDFIKSHVTESVYTLNHPEGLVALKDVSMA